MDQCVLNVNYRLKPETKFGFLLNLYVLSENFRLLKVDRLVYPECCFLQFVYKKVNFGVLLIRECFAEALG
ncbi:hypothetical protein A4A49_21560 [Nicotiana attenuata]|uniref:Uncharacterized protein n=1 Tax=Nicotiana attenuata TaxID=49451 RepID=A0A314LFJ1_NICAT|nr:hypothetical protein A4A49_21560 [Nicotiana attenuata]